MDNKKLPLDKLPLAKRMHTIPIQFNGSENNFTKNIHQIGLSVQSGRILNRRQYK